MVVPLHTLHELVNMAYSSLNDNDKQSKYDVLTLYREYDHKCIVRLEGFDNLVFWKEISLVDRWYHRKSPRQKVIDAQIKAAEIAEKLRRRDEVSEFEYNSAVR